MTKKPVLTTFIGDPSGQISPLGTLAISRYIRTE